LWGVSEGGLLSSSPSRSRPFPHPPPCSSPQQLPFLPAHCWFSYVRPPIADCSPLKQGMYFAATVSELINRWQIHFLRVAPHQSWFFLATLFPSPSRLILTHPPCPVMESPFFLDSADLTTSGIFGHFADGTTSFSSSFFVESIFFRSFRKWTNVIPPLFIVFSPPSKFSFPQNCRVMGFRALVCFLLQRGCDPAPTPPFFKHAVFYVCNDLYATVLTLFPQ